MARLVTTENINITLSTLNFNFSGRRGTQDYDETKMYHIDRRNRAFVWTREMQLGLLDSIMQGYPIPPIYVSSKIENGREIRAVMEGGNRITTIRRLLNGDVRELTPEEKHKVETYSIIIVVMRNLITRQTRELFRRLNKNIKVSDGQLYSMSEDDSPLVAEALALLNDDDYPLRSAITEYFSVKQDKDNDGRGILANAVALISGAINGVSFITKSFDRQTPMVECQTPIDRERLVTILSNVFDVFRQADNIIELNSRSQKRAQFTIGKYLGAILYDILMNPNSIQNIQAKWTAYLVRVRNGTEDAEEAVKISGAQNICPDRLKRISVKVNTFITENRIMTNDEIKDIHHLDDNDGQSDDDSEEESD